jgi:hypothetical protein
MDKHAVEPFTSAGLHRVVPVRQRQIVGGLSITVFSLELYVNGFMIVTRIERTNERPADGVITFRAEDDLGGAYRSWDYAGSGGGIPGKSHYWRYFYLCTPGVNPEASSLRLEVPEVKIIEMQPSGDPTRGPTIETKEQITGPWVFRVSLTEQQMNRDEDV